ncbi:hypothetical protein BJ508DRAFT_198072, partial [Ascobolus immersus RN42]
CTYCRSDLLKAETDGWCCRKGASILPSLPPYSPEIRQFCLAHPRTVSTVSRPLNNLFSFSAIGTTGQFVPFNGPANVAVTGRVYHR